MSDTMKFRPATAEDADFLLRLRNDPRTREASRNMAEIQRHEHLSWLTKTLTDASRSLLIVEENGVPVGTVRVDYGDVTSELSCTVAPEARRRGVGKRMVALLASQIAGPIRAEVKVVNEASRLIAEHAGMKCEREENGVLHYTREALK